MIQKGGDMRLLCNAALVLTALAALVAPWPALCADLSVEEIAEEASKSVVVIAVFDATGNQTAEATGFFVEKGRVLTNAHVVVDAVSVEVVGDRRIYGQATISKISEDIDLALIAVENAEEPSLELSRGDGIRPGQRIIAIGNPLGLEHTVSDGLVSAVRSNGEGLQLIQITAPVSPGSSGGPLFDMQGEVIGVTAQTIEDGQNINFAIGIDSIRAFMRTPSDPKVLLPARERILWRAIIHWVVKAVLVVVGLAIFLFGGGGWAVLVVAFMVVGGLAKALLRALISLRDRARAHSQKRLPPP